MHGTNIHFFIKSMNISSIFVWMDGGKHGWMNEYLAYGWMNKNKYLSLCINWWLKSCDFIFLGPFPCFWGQKFIHIYHYNNSDFHKKGISVFGIAVFIYNCLFSQHTVFSYIMSISFLVPACFSGNIHILLLIDVPCHT